MTADSFSSSSHVNNFHSFAEKNTQKRDSQSIVTFCRKPSSRTLYGGTRHFRHALQDSIPTERSSHDTCETNHTTDYDMSNAELILHLCARESERLCRDLSGHWNSKHDMGDTSLTLHRGSVDSDHIQSATRRRSSLDSHSSPLSLSLQVPLSSDTPVNNPSSTQDFFNDTQFTATDNLVNITMSCQSSQRCGSQKVRREDFVLLQVLGKGSYGKVIMVRYKHDNNIYAMKILRKAHIIKRNQVEHTKTERNVLKAINHPFIVQLYFAFQTPKKLYFVMQYCPGGELFFHLSRAVQFHEKTVIFYAAEILLALEHLHKLNIAYRDLKPENVLLDENGHIRLTDFGLSKEGIQDNFSAKSLCGTPEYLAPEVLNQTGHGKAVDWYNFGTIIYEMLTGLPPFYTRDRESLFLRIRCGVLHYPSCISSSAKSLLKGLLQRDPSRRLGGGPTDATEIKSHPFFVSVDWDKFLEKRETPPFHPCLRSLTDVKYFDNEFISLSVEHSEVNESALITTAATTSYNMLSLVSITYPVSLIITALQYVLFWDSSEDVKFKRKKHEHRRKSR